MRYLLACKIRDDMLSFAGASLAGTGGAPYAELGPDGITEGDIMARTC